MPNYYDNPELLEAEAACHGPRVGDENQRYVVSVYDYNRNERINLYYTDDPKRASELATNAELRPSWKFAWVTDRRPDNGGAES